MHVPVAFVLASQPLIVCVFVTQESMYTMHTPDRVEKDENIMSAGVHTSTGPRSAKAKQAVAAISQSGEFDGGSNTAPLGTCSVS